jgi:hypothetical protein
VRANPKTYRCSTFGCNAAVYEPGVRCTECAEKAKGPKHVPKTENERLKIQPVKKVIKFKRYRTLKEVEELSDKEGVIKIDFTMYSTLHENLKKLAREDFRTPEMQLLAILSDHIELKDGKPEA